MTKQTLIYLVRHGESTANKQSIINGHGDPPLTDIGRDQARQAKRELKDIKFDVAYSSDLRRAIETAEIIYGKPLPKTNQLHNLRERNFGSLEGKPEKLLKADNLQRIKLPDEERWLHKHVPDMESDQELVHRITVALEDITRQKAGKTILVVAHGGAIRTTVMQLTSLTFVDLPTGSFKNAGYAELTYNDKGFKVIQISGVKI